MFPRSTTNNTGNVAMIASEFIGKVFICVQSAGIKFPHFSDLFFSVPGSSVFFAFVRYYSALKSFVSIVVGSCSEPQMLWITTGRVVATMQDTQTIWNRSFYHLPNLSMNQVGRSIIGCPSVAQGVRTSLPFPALIWAKFLDVFPKSCGKQMLAHA